MTTPAEAAMLAFSLVASNVDAQDTLVVRAKPAYLAAPVEIDVPVQRCDFSNDRDGGLPHRGRFDMTVDGRDIVINATQSGLGCFTGQSESLKAVTLTTPPLRPGFYNLRYSLVLDSGPAPYLERSVTFEVPWLPQPVDEIAPAFEYLHFEFNHYFVTAFAHEALVLQSGQFDGWWMILRSLDPEARFGFWQSEAPGRVPLHRFFSTAFGTRSSHFYTADPAEYAGVLANPDWTYEGIAGYVLPPPPDGECTTGKGLYRAYNDGKSGAPNHRFFTSIAHANRVNLLAPDGQGWILEGIVACVPDAK